MSTKKWLNIDGNWSQGAIPQIENKLPAKVYELKQGMSLYLEEICDRFELPSKVYGLERTFIDRVKTTFGHLDKNFGILMKGLKGTGKTVSAKIICNELNLPVILVNAGYNGFGNFLNSIEQDVVLLFDEFEKNFNLSRCDDDDEDSGNKHVNRLLTIMDGVYTSSYKRLFLLTTNECTLPDTLVARPSRIRYIHNFGDLNREAIIEILEDKVTNKELIPELVTFIKGLKNITVDIVKALAEEVNIYNSADEEFLNTMNVLKESEYSDIVEIIDNKDGTVTELVLASSKKINPYSWSKGSQLVAFGNVCGRVWYTSSDDDDYDEKTTILKTVSLDDFNKEKGEDKSKCSSNRTFIIRESLRVHSSMKNYEYCF